MTHWQNFYHDATAEELDEFSVELDARSFSTLSECDEFFDALTSLTQRAVVLRYKVSKFESILRLSTIWRFSRP